MCRVDWDELPFAAVAVCFSYLHGLVLWGSWSSKGPESAGFAGRRVLDRSQAEAVLTHHIPAGLP